MKELSSRTQKAKKGERSPVQSLAEKLEKVWLPFSVFGYSPLAGGMVSLLTPEAELSFKKWLRWLRRCRRIRDRPRSLWEKPTETKRRLRRWARHAKCRIKLAKRCELLANSHQRSFPAFRKAIDDDLQRVRVDARLAHLEARMYLKKLAAESREKGKRASDEVGAAATTEASDVIDEVEREIKAMKWEPTGRYGELRDLTDDLRQRLKSSGRASSINYSRVRSALRRLDLKK